MLAPKTPLPTEAEEQANLVQWLRFKNLPHFRVPNETYTKSWRQKAMNHALGVTRGVPDLFVIKDNKLLGIEMKRLKGSHTSPEQLKWIEQLNDCGVTSAICYGALEAIAFIEAN